MKVVKKKSCQAYFEYHLMGYIFHILPLTPLNVTLIFTNLIIKYKNIKIIISSIITCSFSFLFFLPQTMVKMLLIHFHLS